MLTRDERVEIFKHLHDLLWNGGGFDPITSRNLLLVFFSIRLIEEHSDELGISKESRYSQLIKTIKDGENELLIIDHFMRIIQELRRNTITSTLFINVKVVSGETLRKVFLKIEELSNEDLHSSDILGELYEIVGSGDKSNSDIGQYFTNREICRLIVNTCVTKKSQFYKKIDGENVLKRFLDPFGGTGGFAREYVKRGIEFGINDWENEIYVFDRNNNMIPIILLNLLFTTGKIFKSQDFGNIRSLDSFRDNIRTGKERSRFPGVEYDFIFTNPPFGGDLKKDSGFIYSSSSGKGKDKKTTLEVNSDIQTIGIVDNDKVSAAVQLCMSLLAPRGLCAAVLPQGFFFSSNKAKVELRKRLIEDYKVHMIIDIPQDAFLGTTTKTSVLIFQKDKMTDQITFMNMKEEISAVADIEDLRNKNYSLDSKMYIEREEVDIEGFEMMRLGDLAEISKNKSNKTLDKYLYLNLSSVSDGEIVEFEEIETDLLPKRAQYEVEIDDILIGTVRPNLKHYLFMNKTKWRNDIIVSNAFAVLKAKKGVNPYFLYISITSKNIVDLMSEIAESNGTLYPILNVGKMMDIKIPVPSIEKQNEIVEQIHNWDELIQSETNQLKKMEKAILLFTKNICRNSPRVKLDTFCDFKGGKSITKGDLVEGSFPVIGGGIKEMGFHNEYNQKPFTITMSQVGSCGFVSRRSIPTWITSNAMIISSNDDNLNEDFLYYLLKLNEYHIMSLGNGTAQHKISMKTMKELELNIPSLEKQLILSTVYQEVRNKMKIINEYSKIMKTIIEEVIPKI